MVAFAPPRSLVKAARRLNPALDVEVDVVAVLSADGSSTTEEWTAGSTRTNVTLNESGEVRLAESASRTLFQSPGASTDATKHYHWFNAGNRNQNETLWLDFWPNPSIIGVNGFTLHSLDVRLGRAEGDGVFGSPSIFDRDGGYYRFVVTRFDEKWNREVLGDAIFIKATDVTNSGGVVTIDFRDHGRTVAVTTGLIHTATGSGRDSSGVERAVDFTVEGDLKVSHLNVVRGFSIGISVQGPNPGAAWLGTLQNASFPQFDKSTFWRTDVGAGGDGDNCCGPYASVADGYSALATENNPGYGLLETGAVPGYGAKDTTLTTGGVVNGQWGISRQVGTPQTGQTAEEPWTQPWHVVRGVTYAATGTLVKTYDLGHVPTNEVHFRADGAMPTGTSLSYSLRGRNLTTDAWTSIGAVLDGVVLTGAQRFRYYELTATLGASADSLATPVLQAAFFTERTRFATARYMQDVDSTASIDPTTAQSEIGELKLPLLKLGRGGARDLVTRIATEYAPSNVEAWVYATETITGTRHFLNLYRLEDREPQLGAETLTFVSGMDRLKVLVPPKVPVWDYPVDGTDGVIHTVSYNSTTKELTLTVLDAHAFDGVNIVTTRYEGRSGVLAGTNWFVASSPAPTANGFTIVLEDDAQKPAVGDLFRLHADKTTRAEVAYSGVDFAAVYADILANQAAVPQRYRGILPATTGRLTSNKLSTDGVEALTPLQHVALHCGGAPAWRKGRIDYIDIYGEKDVVAVWSEKDYSALTTPTGYSQRMPSIGIKYGYDQASGDFAYEATFDDINAVLGLGRANLFDVTSLPDDLCKWNDYDEAQHLGQKLLKAWSTGVRLWKASLVHPWPWVFEGDAVSVSTDVYTDRRLDFSTDGINDTGTPIRGRISAVGVVVERNLLGTEFTLAIRGLDAITSVSGTDGTRQLPAPPPVPLVPCPAITSSVVKVGGLLTIFRPDIYINFTKPTDVAYDHMELTVSADGDAAGALASGVDSPIRFSAVTGSTYVVTPYTVNTAGQKQAGDSITVVVDDDLRIPRGVPFVDATGADDGYAVAATDATGTTVDQAVTQSDGVAPRSLVKGYTSGTARNTDTVSFAQPFNNSPMILLRGGISYEPRSKWNSTGDGTGSTAPNTALPQYDELTALNPTTTGFTLRARLRQKGTPVSQTDTFGAGTLDAVGETLAVTLAHAPASNDTYTVNFNVSLQALGGDFDHVDVACTVAIDTSADAGGTWTERWTNLYTASDTHGDAEGTFTPSVPIAVTGLDNTDKIRIRIKTLSGHPTGGFSATVDPGTVTYTTSGSDKYASKTPDADDVIEWEALAK